MKRILARTLVSFALLGLSLSIPAFSADTAALFMTHPTDVNGAVREVLSLFDPLLLQKNIRVVLEVGSSKIPGAPGKFMEMTLNMLSNLLVHSPSGSCLRVSFDAEYGILRVSVSSKEVPVSAAREIRDAMGYTYTYESWQGVGIALSAQLPVLEASRP